MRIEIYYLNGRYKVVDTANLVEYSPFKHDNLNDKKNYDEKMNNIVVATQFDFRLDEMIDSEDESWKINGLVLLVNYYVTEIDQRSEDIKYRYSHKNSSIDYFYAPLRVGRALQIISSSEMENISRIIVDGNEVAWRINGKLVNGTKFNEQKKLYLTDEHSKSFCSEAFELWMFMDRLPEYKNTSEEVKKQIIANRIGIDVECLNNIIKEQLTARVSEDDSEEEE